MATEDPNAGGTPPPEPATAPAQEPGTTTPESIPAEEVPPPVVTPTDQPPPPGPQPPPTTQGPVTNAPSFIAPRTEGGGPGEGASAYLPDGTPMDNVRIVRSTVRNPQTGQEQEVTAAATDPNTVATGAAGQVISGNYEMGGRGVTETHSPRPVEAPRSQANLVERYLQSPLHRSLGTAIGRNPTDLGLVGQGHVVVGHMILMDAESGELHRFLPGTRVEDDRVYVNTRNLPEVLVEGDLARKALGGGRS
jgi:hypothetical protein